MSLQEKYSKLTVSNEKNDNLPQSAQPVSPTIVTVESKFPSLEYDIASNKRGIAIAAFIILSINAIIPVVVYYVLQFGTATPRPIVVTAVEAPTSLLILHWPYRLWLLKKNKAERSPRNTGTFALDAFQWNFLLGAAIVFLFCITGGIKESLRWYILGFVVLYGLSSISFIMTWFLTRKKVRMPFRVSAVPAGSLCRPGIYHFIEDITACEGAGGREYRERLNVRWESSLLFREMLSQITLVFGISMLVQTCVQLIILFTAPEKVFVGLSTVLLWTWFGLTLWWGWRFSQSRIRFEEQKWAADFGSGAYRLQTV